MTKQEELKNVNGVLDWFLEEIRDKLRHDIESEYPKNSRELIIRELLIHTVRLADYKNNNVMNARKDAVDVASLAFLIFLESSKKHAN